MPHLGVRSGGNVSRFYAAVLRVAIKADNARRRSRRANAAGKDAFRAGSAMLLLAGWKA
jgi:hypothetical protein